nr:hypothetical protein [Prevotella sp.]
MPRTSIPSASSNQQTSCIVCPCGPINIEQASCIVYPCGSSRTKNSNFAAGVDL